MQEQFKYNNIDLIKVFIKNFRLIMIITIIGAIVSIIVALLITPKFKSSVIIYPVSNSSVSKDLLTDISRASKDILRFGEEEETEQLLQILKSDEIKAMIINKYDLMNHYKIDPDAEFRKTALLKKYEKNIKSKKTEFMAVEISVMDTDPEFAANIANDISNYVDTIFHRIQKQRALNALKIVKEVYNNQAKLVKTLKDSIKNITVKNEATILLKHSEEEIKQLSLLKSKYIEAQVDAKNDLSHRYIVNKAQVSEKKSYPIRWLIVSISTFSTFIFAFFLILLIERFNAIRKELFS